MCDYIAADDQFNDKKEESFRLFVESEMQNQYGSGLSFTVNSLSGPYELNPSPTEIDYVFYTLLGVVGLMVIVAGFALMFNEGLLPVFPPCHTVDSGKWSAILSFATQFYDLSSDAVFTVDVWTTWSALSSGSTQQKQKVLISAIGSTSFLVIPYFVNLYSATRVKRKGGVIARNNAVQTWFNAHSMIFIGFTMLSGSTYTAMQVIKSKVFGINLVSCGLTQFELKKLFHLKVLNNVFLQEVTQLIFVSLFAKCNGRLD